MTSQTFLQLCLTVIVIAAATFLTRALAFLLFPAGKETPRAVQYLGPSERLCRDARRILF